VTLLYKHKLKENENITTTIITIIHLYLVKVKLSLCRPWRPLGLREVEAPPFSDIRHTDGGKVVRPTRRPLFTPGRFLVLISVRGRVDTRAIVRLQILSKLKKSTSSGIRTGDFPACSTLPQPTTLPHASTLHLVKTLIISSILAYLMVYCKWPG
jgi:hypothetical protein